MLTNRMCNAVCIGKHVRNFDPMQTQSNQVEKVKEWNSNFKMKPRLLQQAFHFNNSSACNKIKETVKSFTGFFFLDIHPSIHPFISPTIHSLLYPSIHPPILPLQNFLKNLSLHLNNNPIYSKCLKF